MGLITPRERMKRKLYRSSPPPIFQGFDQPNSSNDISEEELWEEHVAHLEALDFIVAVELDSDESIEDNYDDPKDDYPQWNNKR